MHHTEEPVRRPLCLMDRRVFCHVHKKGAVHTEPDVARINALKAEAGSK